MTHTKFMIDKSPKTDKTEEQLKELGYTTFSKFAKKNYLKFDAVKLLQKEGKISVVLSSEGKPMITPESAVSLTPFEREVLNRNASLQEFSKRENIKDIRIRSKEVVSIYEEYVTRTTLGENVDIYLDLEKKKQFVASEDEITDKKRYRSVTAGILGMMEPVNTHTIKTEETWLILEFSYNVFRVIFDDNGVIKKYFFYTEEEARKFARENGNVYGEIEIRHHGYSLCTYKDGQFTEVNEEKKAAEERERRAAFNKLMKEIDAMD